MQRETMPVLEADETVETLTMADGLENVSEATNAKGDEFFVRGIQVDRCALGRSERLPTASELVALPEDARELMIWKSGVSPNTQEMIAAFRSLAHRPGLGWIIAAAADCGYPPNPRFYKGEGRLDVLVWPDGYPAELMKKPPPKWPAHFGRRSRREQEAERRALDAEFGLFPRLSCGCVAECPGEEWHASVNAVEEARERELVQSHALFDARRAFEDELARVTLNEPVEVDPETASEFASILAPVNDE